MTDLKTSLLINRQFPEFVRDEHPNFILFLEAYYEFLDQNGYGKSKELKNISDVDLSLEEFEKQFYNTFLPFISKDSSLSKEKLIKNILPLYLSKGSEKSYRLLFRMLFNEEINLQFPKNNILRASDGRWVIENIIRVETNIYSQYVSDGVNEKYYLPYSIDPENIEIFVDDNLFEDYHVFKEYKRIELLTIPPKNSIIQIFYRGSFDLSIFENRQLKGVVSNSSCIVEKVGVRNIAGSNFYQIFIDERTLLGNFTFGELLEIDVISGNNVIPFFFQTSSDVINLIIEEPGSSYKVGDSLIFRGSSKKTAIAVVDEVSTGNIVVVTPKIGNYGAGYAPGNEVIANNYPLEFFTATIDAVDSSGTISPNTIVYDVNVISDFLSNTISDDTFNLSTSLNDSLSLEILTNLGPAINVAVTSSLLGTDTTPNFEAKSTVLFDDKTVSDLGCIGTIKVIEPGESYQVGDKVKFVNTFYFSGQGAEAVVSSVNDLGGILSVTVINTGYAYSKEYLPNIVIESDSGSNAVLEIEHFMGEGALFDFVPGDGIDGKILSVKLLDPGIGYNFPPIVDMTLSGDGNAIITSNIRESFIKLPGRWTTSDGILSTDEMRLQGRDYYIDFSYVITSRIEFDKYKNIVKNLLNPAGFVNYSQYKIVDNIDSFLTLDVDSSPTLELVGTVSVTSGNSFVNGTRTFFKLAEEIGLLSEGNYILVNSEIRIVNSIINNTTFTVSESFDFDANNQLITIFEYPYKSITTEYWREVAISVEGPRSIILTTEEEY
jgi:hypothetical protein